MHITNLVKEKQMGERCFWFGGDDLRGKIAQWSCRQYKPVRYLAVRSLKWDEIIDEDGDDENRVHPRVPCSGRICPGDGDDSDNGEGENDMKGAEKGTGNGTETQDEMVQGERKVKAMEVGKGKGNGNGKGKGIVNQTPGGDDIAPAFALQLQKEMHRTDLDMEG